ncbi:MAG: 4Fe-4S binding protein [Deltaproteobacteria bacterium]|nr:4Fe-4S binding protein [Deltaproteobacteria bacterium]
MKRLRLDLLRYRPVAWLVKKKFFPLGVQVLVLGIVLAVAAIGWGRGVGMDASELLLFRKTNLATLLVWGLWWPAMIVAVVLVGRVWCAVCPLELVNRFADALARKVGWRRAALGPFLRAGWIMLAGYVTLQILVVVVDLHRMPHYSAVVIVSLIGAAFLSGLFFKHPRSFCRAFCPVGALLSAYGRQTAVQLEVRDDDVCARCETKDCIREKNRYRLDARSCPSLLKPFDRGPSDGCLVCLQCAKACPHDNVGFGLVLPDAPIRRKSLLEPFEAGFILMAAGFLVHETTEHIAWMDRAFTALPHRLAPASVPWHWVEGAWYLFVFPLFVWTAVVVSVRLVRGGGPWGRTIRAAATGAAPLVAMAHLAKALSKIGGWAAYLPGALVDPSGLTTFRDITVGATSAPGPLYGLGVLGRLVLPFFLAVGWWAWRWIGRLPEQDRAPARGGWLLGLLLFGVILVSWGLTA